MINNRIFCSVVFLITLSSALQAMEDGSLTQPPQSLIMHQNNARKDIQKALTTGRLKYWEGKLRVVSDVSDGTLNKAQCGLIGCGILCCGGAIVPTAVGGFAWVGLAQALYGLGCVSYAASYLACLEGSQRKTLNSPSYIFWKKLFQNVEERGDYPDFSDNSGDDVEEKKERMLKLFDAMEQGDALHKEAVSGWCWYYIPEKPYPVIYLDKGYCNTSKIYRRTLEKEFSAMPKIVLDAFAEAAVLHYNPEGTPGQTTLKQKFEASLNVLLVQRNQLLNEEESEEASRKGDQ